MILNEGEREEGKNSSLGMVGKMESVVGEQRDYAFQKWLKVGGVKYDQPPLQARYLNPLVHSCTQMVNTSLWCYLQWKLRKHGNQTRMHMPI